MKQFSISELEQLSDIKAHTIRMWEQRYAVFRPQRTDSNLRRYDINDLSLLLDVSILVNNGFKISKIVALTREQIRARLSVMKDGSVRKRRSVNELIYNMYAIQINEFDEVVEGALLSWGFDLTMREIVIPFLAKVNLLSYDNSSMEAHFAVTSIRRKLMYGIESLISKQENDRTVLLFLPKDEHYDLMLLYIYYLLKKSGLKPLYLGTNISLSNLKEVCADKKPSLFFSYSCLEQITRLNDYGVLLDTHPLNAPLYVVHAHEGTHLKSAIGNMYYLDYRDVEHIVSSHNKD